jgi:RNA polymerase sigma-70 factor (ECF subfamily)
LQPTTKASKGQIYMSIGDLPTDESREIFSEEERHAASNAGITRLLIKHRCDLYGYILACVRNHHDAEEVFQELSVGVVTSFHKLRAEEEFLPWSIEIARRQVLSFYRRSKRPIVYDTELVGVLAEAANRCQDAPKIENRDQIVRECVEKLPHRSQEVLRLRYGDSFAGVDQIAAHLRRSMPATYGILKRIRMALRQCIEQSCAEKGVK